MKERKNLENLFQEKFQNFEIVPPENVWDEIKIKLEEKKEKKKVIPFWWKLSGIAAALIIGIFIFNTTLDTTSTIMPTQINNETNTSVGTTDLNSDNSNAIVNSQQSDDNKRVINYKTGNPSNAIVNSKNKLSNSKFKNSVAIIENPSENEATISSESTISSSVKNTKKSKINTTIVTAAANEKKGNTFYNYQKKELVLAENSVEDEIIARKKSSKFNKNKSFESITSRQNSNEISLANKNSNENTTENSMLNIGSKNSNVLNSNFDKNTASNNNNGSKNTINSIDNKEIELKLLEEQTKIDSTKIAIVEPNALEELLKEKGKLIVKEPKLNRWQITSNVAPIYFSSTGNNGSSLDSKFENNSKSYNTDYSYGLGVNYKLDKRFKVRAGVNSVSFNYNTNDVLFYQSTVASKIENLNTNQKGDFIQIESKNEKGVNTPTLVESGYTLKKFDSSLNQKIGYLEVPLEMSYTLLNKKFSIEILGGFSTLFLNQNEVFLESKNLKMDIGEATNLNDIHFSGNFGLGFKYGFLKNLEAKVEPVFKYQMNTYTTDTGDFKPYFIGVYTGLTYNF